MAGNTLTVSSTLQCPHGGTVQIIPGNLKVKADSGNVATTADTYVISGCPFQIPATPPIPSPCVTVQWIVSNLKVKAGGVQTLSTQSTGLCLSPAQLPQGPVSIINTQAKVSSL